jgi:mannose-6-phosphate isomerase-like protein (cupin superfamily)
VLTAPQNASASIFRLSETSDQANYPMGGWLARHTEYRKIAVMAADFAGGRHSVEAFMAGFRAAGGEIAGEIYPLFGTADYAPYLDRLRTMAADAVYAWFAGADAVHFLKQYAGASRLPLTGHSALTGESVLAAAGDAALGITAVGAYTATLDSPENRHFVREYETAYQSRPSRYSECGWAAAALISTAVESLEGDLSQPERVREALKVALPRIKPPRGPMLFDAYRQAVTPIYITRTERRDGRIENVVIDKIPAVSQEDTWGWWNKESYTAEGCYITELSNTSGDPEASIARARVLPGVTTRWHRLIGTTERYVILEGSGRVEVGDEPARDVGPGEVVVIAPLVRQRITNVGTADLIFLAVCTPRFTRECYEDVEKP